MKTILILLLFTISFNLSAQETNFKIKNNKPIWQIVYNDSITKIDFYNNKKNNNIFQSLSKNEFNDNQIDFVIKYDFTHLKPFGYKYFTSQILLRYDSFLYGNIEFKDNKYRVTISKIESIGIDDEIFNLLDLFVKKNKYKTSKSYIKSLLILNNFYSSIFVNTENSNDDW